MWDYLDGMKEQTEERPNLILMFHSGFFRFVGCTIGDKFCLLCTEIYTNFFRCKLFTPQLKPDWAQPVHVYFSFCLKFQKVYATDKLESENQFTEFRSVPCLLSLVFVSGQGVSRVAGRNSI